MPQEQNDNKQITDDGSRVTEGNIKSVNHDRSTKNKLIWWVLGIVVLIGIGLGIFFLRKNNNINVSLTAPTENQPIVIGETIKLKWKIDKKYPESDLVVALLNSKEGGYSKMVIGSIPINLSNELEWKVDSSIRWSDVLVPINPGKYTIDLVLLKGSICGFTDGECIGGRDYQIITQSKPVFINIIK